MKTVGGVSPSPGRTEGLAHAYTARDKRPRRIVLLQGLSIPRPHCALVREESLFHTWSLPRGLCVGPFQGLGRRTIGQRWTRIVLKRQSVHPLIFDKIYKTWAFANPSADALRCHCFGRIIVPRHGFDSHSEYSSGMALRNSLAQSKN